MTLTDRFRVVKRAVLTAFNPKLEVLKISYVNKENEVFSRYIHENKEVAKQLFLAEMERMFTENAKSAKGLEIMLINFVTGLEKRWNADHPDDTLSIIKHKEEADEEDAA